MSSASDVSPVLVLRAAVYDALVADDILADLSGGPRVFDEAPRGARGLYVAFGPAQARDRSAGGLSLESQQLTLNVWAPAGAQRLALGVAARIRAIVADGLAMDGRTLVLLRVLREDVARDTRTGGWRVRLTLAAITAGAAA